MYQLIDEEPPLLCNASKCFSATIIAGLFHLDPLAGGILKNAVLKTRRPKRTATERKVI
jgi:hypothetical protein